MVFESYKGVSVSPAVANPSQSDAPVSEFAKIRSSSGRVQLPRSRSNKPKSIRPERKDLTARDKEDAAGLYESSYPLRVQCAENLAGDDLVRETDAVVRAMLVIAPEVVARFQ